MPEQEHKGFEIDGRVYPLPILDTLKMPEAQLMYDHCGLTIEDFVPPDEEADDYTDELREEWEQSIVHKVKNPGFMFSMVAIAYWRGNPRKDRAAVEKVASEANFLQATAELVLAGMDAEDDDPKADSQNAPESPKRSSSTDYDKGSGQSSESDSDEPDSPLSPIGLGN